MCIRDRFYIWQMTENIVLAGAAEAIGAVISVVLYFVRSSLYENLLTNVLGKLALANVFTDITNNSIVDVTGIVLYLSIIAVFAVSYTHLSSGMNEKILTKEEVRDSLAKSNIIFITVGSNDLLNECKRMVQEILNTDTKLSLIHI